MNTFKKLDAITFETFLRDHPLSRLNPCLDLREYELITPAAMTQLAALCHALAKQGPKPTILLGNGEVDSYLLRSQFVEAVKSVARFDPEIGTLRSKMYERLRGTNPLLIEVTRIQAGEELPDLLDRVVNVLKLRLKYEKDHAFDIATAVSEVAQNTFDHNSDTCGFIAMQVYGSGSEQFLEIGIGDYGEGLATTLRRNSRHAGIQTDIQAIDVATDLGTSEHEDPTRGTGLYHLLRIAYDHMGAVQIWSGAGKVRYRMDKRKGWAFTVPTIPGVHVALSLPSKRR